jgi:hypothetical protein
LVLQETRYLGVCKLRKLINLVVLTECRWIPEQCFQIVESVDNGRRKTATEIFSVILFFRGCLGVELSLYTSCCFPYKYQIWGTPLSVFSQKKMWILRFSVWFAGWDFTRWRWEAIYLSLNLLLKDLWRLYIPFTRFSSLSIHKADSEWFTLSSSCFITFFQCIKNLQ